MTAVDELAALAAGLAVIERFTRDKGGEKPPEEESNTYGLPLGPGLTDELKRWFRRQKQWVLGHIPHGPLAELPEEIPSVTDWDDEMARACVPYISATWDARGKKTMARLGLDPAAFSVTNPELRRAVRSASLAFCKSTNETTDEQLGRALTRLRAELEKGLVDRGESVRLLTDRVKGVFNRAEEFRARRIAATESARAYHAAQLWADEKSGVVAGLELLLSSDACPLCRKIATECKRVRLGQAFAVIGDHPDYGSIRHPPIHPNCQCSMVEVLTPEHGGPADPKFDETLIQPKVEGKEYTPPPGKKTPEPEPEKKDRPEGNPPPPPGPQAVLPGRPIKERLEAYAEGDRKIAAIHEAEGTFHKENLALMHERSDIRGRMESLAEEFDGLTAARPRSPEKIAAKQARQEAIAAELAELQAKMEATEKAKQALRDKRDAAVMEVIRYHGPTVEFKHRDPPPGTVDRVEESPGRWVSHPVLPMSAATRENHRKAAEWLGKVVAAAPGSGAIDVHTGEYSGARAFFMNRHDAHGNGLICLQPGEKPSIIAHEYGHGIEYRTPSSDGRPNLTRVSMEFLDYRIGDEQAVDIGKKFGIKKMEGELGRKDKFDKAFSEGSAYYVGKMYVDATEVISMGLQKLMEDPVTFAEKDPEYCKFILGIADGALR
jgi:hypothetical protein